MKVVKINPGYFLLEQGNHFDDQALCNTLQCFSSDGCHSCARDSDKERALVCLGCKDGEDRTKHCSDRGRSAISAQIGSPHLFTFYGSHLVTC